MKSSPKYAKLIDRPQLKPAREWSTAPEGETSFDSKERFYPMWKDVSKIIREHKRFVVTTHIHPEGDAVGSEVALTGFLRNLGKEVEIVNSSPTPANCVFLPLAGTIKVYPEQYTADIMGKTDAVIIVDVNNWAHLGPFADEIRKTPKQRVCIDHHQGGDRDLAAVTVNDTGASAAGLLIYDLINYMQGDMTLPIAEALYTAIATDTGSFRFSNTNERAFRAASDLCKIGVDPFAIYREAYAKSWGGANLIGPVLSTLERTPDGRIAWIQVTQRMLERAGAMYEDSDDLLELLRPIRGVELCIAFKEIAGGKIKVSLRSNGKIDAFDIAKRHGGGGHRMAAGVTIDGPMAKAIETLVAECAQEGSSE